MTHPIIYAVHVVDEQDDFVVYRTSELTAQSTARSQRTRRPNAVIEITVGAFVPTAIIP